MAARAARTLRGNADGLEYRQPLERKGLCLSRQFLEILLRGVQGLAVLDEPLALGLDDRPDESRPKLRLGVALLACKQKQLGWARLEDAHAGHRRGQIRGITRMPRSLAQIGVERRAAWPRYFDHL